MDERKMKEYSRILLGTGAVLFLVALALPKFGVFSEPLGDFWLYCLFASVILSVLRSFKIRREAD